MAKKATESRFGAPLPFWRSRIFMLSGLVVIALTVLVAMDKIDMTSSALTTVFLGLVAAVAGLSRRGTELQAQTGIERRHSTNDAARILEAMTPLFEKASSRDNLPIIPIPPPPPPPPTAVSAEQETAEMPMVIDTVGGRAMRLALEEVPTTTDDQKSTDYVRQLNAWLMERKVFRKESLYDLADRLSADFTSSLPDDWTAQQIYESITDMVHDGVLYVVPEDATTISDNDKAKTGEYVARK